MADPENARAQSEAVNSSVNQPPSARRAQIWDGLMRYLSSESQRLRTRPRPSGETQPPRPGRAGPGPADRPDSRT